MAVASSSYGCGDAPGKAWQGDAPGKAVARGAKPAVMGELLPWTGRRHADRLASGEWVITDSLTGAKVGMVGCFLEVVEADEGVVVMETDDEGEAVRFMDPEDILPKTVYSIAQGELCVRHFMPNQKAHTYSLDQSLPNHREGCLLHAGLEQRRSYVGRERLRVASPRQPADVLRYDQPLQDPGPPRLQRPGL